jgi:hypothetical protein
MLRVQFDDDGSGTLTVRLEGRLVGLYAEDARVSLARYQVPAAIQVDVSQVTFVDGFGEKVLLWLGRLGARFIGVNVYTRSICERLQLEMSEQRAETESGTDTQVLA